MPNIFKKQFLIFLSAFLLTSSISVYSKEDELKDTQTAIVSLFEMDDLKEIAEKNKNIQIYRLLVERAFDPPLMFELVYSGNSQTLTVRKSNREVSGSLAAYTKVTRNSILKLQSQEIKSFLALLSACSFWALPAKEWQLQGVDGSTWTLEAIRDGKYHKVVRSNPFTPIEKSTTSEERKAIGIERAYSEGLLTSAFVYLWVLSGEAVEELY